MQYTSKTTRVYRDQEADRRRESTLSHVLRSWFPATPDLFALIAGQQESADSHQSELDPAQLIETLKCDLATFAKVVSVLKPGSESTQHVISPLEDLERLSSAELCALLPKSAEQVSRHKIGRSSVRLRSIIACSLTSSAASEAFAAEGEKRGLLLSGQTAFSSSMLRQLGVNLLAWNYPSLFFRIIRTSRNDPAGQDKAFARSLGFTPLTLAAECARRWNIAPQLRNTLEEASPYSRTNSLREICELGDTFGKKNHPGLFPTARRDWDERKERLKDLIGTDNCHEITEKVEVHLDEKLKRLFQTEPKKFNLAFSRLRPAKSASFWMGHPSLKQLPEEISREYLPIYKELEQAQTSVTALMALTQRAIPASGFVRGLICVADANGEALRPAIRIGLQAQDNGLLRSLTETALESRESSIPMLKEELLANGSRSTRISSSFSGDSYSGVLVLELDTSWESTPEHNQIALFTAARECLEHCLG